MPTHKAVHDLESHFVVEPQDGSRPFRIAKHGLAHQTVQKLQALCKGGAVKGYSEGGDVEPDPPMWPSAEADPARFGLPVPPPPRPESGISPVADMPPEAAAQVAMLRRPAPHDAATNGVQLAPEPGQQPPPLPDVPAAPPKPPGPPKAPDALRQAQANEQGAVGDLATLKQQQQTRVATEQATAADAMKASVDESRDMLATRLQRQEALYNDMVNAKIDPNRYWHNQSTGGKVSAAIGLILGGIGAGLTKGPNYALEVINKAIDRDMEAQKLDMHNRQTGLGMYMQQTRDLQSAQHLMRADYYTAAAAKLQATMSTMAGERAQAEGAQQLATLQRAAVTETQQWQQRDLQVRQEAIEAPLRTQALRQQVEMGGTQLGMAKAQMQAVHALTSGLSEPGHAGAKVDPRVVEFLPPEIRSRMVSMPDGSYAMARTPEAAKDVQATQETMATLRSKVQRLSSLLDKHPNGTSQILSPEDYEAAQVLQNSILTDINSLAGLSRFTHEEAKIFSKRVTDVTTLGREGPKRASIGELGKEMDEKVWQKNQNWLNTPRRSRPGG
jgi:hypothetical protein